MDENAITLTATRGRVRLRLTALPMGQDLCVTLTGGDRAHLGAVALAHPRPSLAAPGRVGATTSVLALSGHKEDDLARTLASRLAIALEVTVCVACGIHVEHIQETELQDVQALADQLALALADRLRTDCQ